MARRPDGKNWAPKEIVCHLRVTEEAFARRFEQILAMEVDSQARRADGRPLGRGAPVSPQRPAGSDRRLPQAPRGKPRHAPRAHARAMEQGRPPSGARRMTLDTFLNLMAWHDDNHLDQLARALEGKA